MKFSIEPYIKTFKTDCIEKGIWHDTTYQECFNGLGFSSYKYGYGGGNRLPHYLSDEEFLIFVLRYSS